MEPTIEERLATAEGELQGSQRRLALADQAILNFKREHVGVVGGRECYLAEDINTRAALDRQWHVLLLERDESFRQWRKSLGDRNTLLPRRSCIGPAKVDAL